MIILDIQVVAAGDTIGQKIGNPQPFKPGAAGAGAASAAAPVSEPKVSSTINSGPAAGM